MTFCIYHGTHNCTSDHAAMRKDEMKARAMLDAMFDSNAEDHFAHHESFASGAEWGAGWMAALIGMGEAVRSTDDYRREHTCSFCGLVDCGGAGACPAAPECPF